MDKSVIDYISPPERTGIPPREARFLKVMTLACIAGVTLGSIGLLGWNLNNNRNTYDYYLEA